MGCAQSKTEDVATPAAEAAPASTTPAETEPVAAEPIAEEPVAEEVTAAPAAAEAEAEPEAEAAAAEEPAKELYMVTGHAIEENGVVYYTVEATEGESSFKKRFSEFKALVVELGSPKTLPPLPSSGLASKVRGKHSPELIKERETQLAVVLNAIANDSELAEKEPFKKFVE
ncbi:hypothetical protein PHYBOEH_003826 [Phytophthora boehmeriae]|uniref:PX domain-containing protein n=1 Tax=Phytophthora boehmeriae TaxID=109152 RepID=A0A8T1X4M2_9STRA|nr:hypothetical protein PHYBOEH_003826 [Phytophthora boehmeriae]